ncbi:MAG: hypothetical protein LC789_09405 [Actinobacteria bacterium]|nr:hypothetical protein [Actinomycetota bacterium]
MARRPIPDAELTTWVTERLPDDWFSAVEVTSDHEEILVIGTLTEPERGDATDALHEAACESAVAEFREVTRRDRIGVAREAEHTLGRTLSWGVRCGPVLRLFTSNTVPVMTRLRLPERRVLDTLVDAGVARSRSEALSWAVKRVGETEADWLAQLREAFAHVAAVREGGPDVA